jgi:hypothetical protein
MGKLVLRKTILRNMIDRVWAALQLLGEAEAQHENLIQNISPFLLSLLIELFSSVLVVEFER